MNQAPEASVGARTLGYLRLPHAVPIVIVMTATAGTIAILGEEVAVRTWAAILIAMLGAQVALGVVNELVDLRLDRTTKPSKPLVDGTVTIAGARRMLLGALLLMIGAGATLGIAGLTLCVGGCAIGIAYSIWFKRSRFAWVPYLAALPVLPIWVAVCVGVFTRSLLWLYPLGVCCVIGVQLAQAVPDVEADRAAGIESVTTRLGEGRSLLLCWATLAISAALVVIAGGRDGNLLIATMITLALIVFDAALVAVRRRAGVLAAFPAVAAGTVVLGIAWIYAVGN